MRLIIKQKANSKDFIAYFEGTHLFGYGRTREDAVQDLIDKMHAVLEAIGNVQRNM